MSRSAAGSAVTSSGHTSLHSAESSGDEEEVRKLLELGAHFVNCTDSLRQTSLHCATIKGHLAVVHLLLTKFNAEVDIQDTVGRTALHYACNEGHGTLVRVLCNHQADISIADHENVAPIHVAALRGHANIVLCLINEFGCDPNQIGGIGRSLLHYACQGGNLELIRILIHEHKADICAIDYEKIKPIHVAAWKGHTEVVLCLIDEFKCNPNDSGGLGRSLLHHACQGGNLDLVQMLICEYNADVNTVDFEQDPPIHVAAWNGHVDVVQSLINKFDCDPNIKGWHGSSLLHRACQGGNITLVRTLIKLHKADVNAKDNENHSPLYVAFQNHHFEIVLCLIEEFGCDSDIFGDGTLVHPLVQALLENETTVIRTSSELMPVVDDDSVHKELCFINKFENDSCNRSNLRRYLLHCACKNNNVNLVKTLVSEYSLSPLLADNAGNTPLHISAHFNHCGCVEFLLKAKASVLVRNSSGLRPVDVATGEAKGCLQQYMANNHDELHTCENNDMYLDHIKREYPGRYTILRVFVIGGPAVGKSSLIESLKRGFYNLTERVTESAVPPHTAGIIPSIHRNQQHGIVCFYDLAGDPEYYSSHAAILEKLSILKSGHNVFIIVIDIRNDDVQMENILHYWVSFIQYQKFTHTQLSLTIVCSHADLVSSIEVQEKQDFVQDLCKEHFKSALATPRTTCFALDCCNPKAQSFEAFKSQILSWKRLSPAYALFTDLSLLLGLLEIEFKEVTACPIKAIISHISDTGIHLPNSNKDLWPILNALQNAGLLLLFNDHSSDSGGYHVVLNCPKLTNEVHSLLFAKSSVEKLKRKYHRRVQTSCFDIGIIPAVIIRDILPSHITEECLFQLQFCQKISYNDIDAFPSIPSPKSSKQDFLFFPALCRARKQYVSLPLDYGIGWLAHCIDPQGYFPPRFLHVLLFTLIFKFTLSAPTQSHSPCPSNLDDEYRYFQRRCTMWKTGVHWLMTQGVECVVELVDGNKGVVVICRSKEDRAENCIDVFNKVINCVMEVKARFCHCIKPSFYLLESTDEADYLCPDNHYAMSDVERALVLPEENNVIVSVSGMKMMEHTRLLCMRKLTHWNSIFPIDSKDVLSHLKVIVKELYSLGKYLGISHSTIKGIEEDFRYSIDRRRQELVRVWMSTSMDPPCWWQLVKALREIDYNCLSAEIERKYSNHVQLQMKLLDNQSLSLQPSEEFLRLFSGEVESKWPSLAISLSLSENEIGKVKMKDLAQNEQALEMLKLWVIKENATYGELCRALKTISLFQYVS